jgi:hypothetical protein
VLDEATVISSVTCSLVVLGLILAFRVFVNMKMTAFWHMVPFSFTGVDQCFRGVMSIHMMEEGHTHVEHQSTAARLHGAISQKAVIFMLAAVRT